MKPSSRSGRFKKKLITHQQLQQEVPQFLALFEQSLSLFREDLITAPELCAHYLFTGLSIRYPGAWPGAQQTGEDIPHQLHYEFPQHIPLEPNVRKRIAGLSMGDILNQFAFKSTPKSINRSLLHFSQGTYPLQLMFKIPTPREVLLQQKQGRRCLTLITKEKQMKEYILGERDYLGFCLHDLIHADHFYRSSMSYQGQLGLYNLLWQEMEKGIFNELLANKEFEDEFEYIIADMNAYPIHLLKCLKSAMVFYGSDEDFNRWSSQFAVKKNLMRLNSKDYCPLNEDHLLLEWLNSYLGNELP